MWVLCVNSVGVYESHYFNDNHCGCSSQQTL